MADHTVDLVVKNETPTSVNGEPEDGNKTKPSRRPISPLKRLLITFGVPIISAPFDICALIAVARMVYQASNTTNCDYLSNQLFPLIMLGSLIATTLFSVCAFKMSFRGRFQVYRGNRTRDTILYFLSLIFYTVMFWMQQDLADDMEDYFKETGAESCQMNQTFFDIFAFALYAKSIYFMTAFTLLLMYKLKKRFFPNGSRCFSCCAVTFVMLVNFWFIGFYLWEYGYLHIHSIGALIGVLHLKFCAGGHHGVHHVTSTYEEGQPESVGSCCKCCKAGFGFRPSHGCCECNCRSGGCCICCGWNIFRCMCCENPSGVPGTACCSCCGCYTIFCCDPGGCYDACFYSVDYCTWC